MTLPFYFATTETNHSIQLFFMAYPIKNLLIWNRNDISTQSIHSIWSNFSRQIDGSIFLNCFFHWQLEQTMNPFVKFTTVQIVYKWSQTKNAFYREKVSKSFYCSNLFFVHFFFICIDIRAIATLLMMEILLTRIKNKTVTRFCIISSLSFSLFRILFKWWESISCFDPISLSRIENHLI